MLIVLMSLVAEGTPQLALQLARQWQQDGLNVEVLVMQPEPRDMQAEFSCWDCRCTGLTWNGLSRYWALLCHSYRLCRRLRARSVMSFPLGWHALWPSVHAWLCIQDLCLCQQSTTDLDWCVI